MIDFLKFICFLSIFLIMGINFVTLMITLACSEDSVFLPLEIWRREFEDEDLTGYNIIKFIGIFTCFIAPLILGGIFYGIFLILKGLLKLFKNPINAVHNLMNTPIKLPKFSIKLERRE